LKCGLPFLFYLRKSNAGHPNNASTLEKYPKRGATDWGNPDREDQDHLLSDKTANFSAALVGKTL